MFQRPPSGQCPSNRNREHKPPLRPAYQRASICKRPTSGYGRPPLAAWLGSQELLRLPAEESEGAEAKSDGDTSFTFNFLEGVR